MEAIYCHPQLFWSVSAHVFYWKLFVHSLLFRKKKKAKKGEGRAANPSFCPKYATPSHAKCHRSKPISGTTVGGEWLGLRGQSLLGNFGMCFFSVSIQWVSVLLRRQSYFSEREEVWDTEQKLFDCFEWQTTTFIGVFSACNCRWCKLRALQQMND